MRNKPFEYTLINKTKYFVRILFQIVNGLETCNAIKFNIYIARLVETNTNWNHPKTKKQIHKT